MKKLGFHYGWIVLAVGTFAVFSALGLGRFGYTMVLPAMQADLNMNNAQAGLLVTFNMAGYLLFAVLGGALSTRYGSRIVASAGLVLAGIGMIGTGLAGSFYTVAVWRWLTGIGSGGNIAVMGLWTAWFSRRKRGRAAGIAVSGSSFALVLTGWFVPWMSAHLGPSSWQTCWIVFGCVSLLAAAAAYLMLRNRPEELGLNAIGHASQKRPEATCPAEPIAWKKVYFSAPVWSLGLVYSAFGFSYVIYMTFFFKFLVQDGGYAPEAAGSLFSLMGWASLFCGVIWGTVSDYIGRRKALAIVYLIHATAFGLFALGGFSVCFTLSAVLFGLSAWSIPAVMNAACGDLLGVRLAPAALGFITLFFGIGQVVGPFVGGMTADKTGAFPPAFLLASVVAFLGAVGSAILIKEKRL